MTPVANLTRSKPADGMLPASQSLTDPQVALLLELFQLLGRLLIDQLDEARRHPDVLANRFKEPSSPPTCQKVHLLISPADAALIRLAVGRSLCL